MLPAPIGLDDGSMSCDVVVRSDVTPGNYAFRNIQIRLCDVVACVSVHPEKFSERCKVLDHLNILL